MTQTGEKTAIFCLAHHDWKLDMALDSYFANPELYFREPKVSVDRKKLEQLYNKYRGNILSTKLHVFSNICEKVRFYVWRARKFLKELVLETRY